MSHEFPHHIIEAGEHLPPEIEFPYIPKIEVETAYNTLIDPNNDIQIIQFRGAPGMGKTRHLNELQQRLETDGITTHRFTTATFAEQFKPEDIEDGDVLIVEMDQLHKEEQNIYRSFRSDLQSLVLDKGVRIIASSNQMEQWLPLQARKRLMYTELQGFNNREIAQALRSQELNNQPELLSLRILKMTGGHPEAVAIATKTWKDWAESTAGQSAQGNALSQFPEFESTAARQIYEQYIKTRIYPMAAEEIRPLIYLLANCQSFDELEVQELAERFQITSTSTIESTRHLKAEILKTSIVRDDPEYVTSYYLDPYVAGLIRHFQKYHQIDHQLSTHLVLLEHNQRLLDENPYEGDPFEEVQALKI